MKVKVRYDFEIDVHEYNKVLCEDCPMLLVESDYFECKLNGEGSSHYYNQNEQHRIDALSYLESKCPLSTNHWR